MTEQDKKIRELLKGNFDEVSPSVDFTKNIMDKISTEEVLEEQKVVAYVPVISKLGWILIGVLFLVVIYFGLTSGTASSFSFTKYIPDFQFDASVMYAQIGVFAIVSVFALLIIDRVFSRFKLG